MNFNERGQSTRSVKAYAWTVKRPRPFIEYVSNNRYETSIFFEEHYPGLVQVNTTEKSLDMWLILGCIGFAYIEKCLTQTSDQFTELLGNFGKEFEGLDAAYKKIKVVADLYKANKDLTTHNFTGQISEFMKRLWDEYVPQNAPSIINVLERLPWICRYAAYALDCSIELIIVLNSDYRFKTYTWEVGKNTMKIGLVFMEASKELMIGIDKRTCEEVYSYWFKPVCVKPCLVKTASLPERLIQESLINTEMAKVLKALKLVYSSIDAPAKEIEERLEQVKQLLDKENKDSPYKLSPLTRSYGPS